MADASASRPSLISLRASDFLASVGRAGVERGNVGQTQGSDMMLKPGKEAVGLALDGWEIALRVFVAAAPLKQLFDRRSIGKHRLVDLDVREIPRKALFLDPRALRRLARDAQVVERRLQVLHHAGREDGHIAEGRQRRLRLLDRVEKRRCALETSEARLLDLASPALRAEPLQLSAELFDIVVQLYP